jgi:hypothetical protein
MTINWSQPTPARRSAIARAAASLSGKAVSRASTQREGGLARIDHDEVVAEAMHLDEGASGHGAVYRAAEGGESTIASDAGSRVHLNKHFKDCYLYLNCTKFYLI